jgi:two-component system, NarL family, nitrate/nitrite response regulator NarL
MLQGVLVGRRHFTQKNKKKERIFMQLVQAKTINVFLVDDHKTVLWGLERLIESASPQMSVVGMAENCDELFAKLPGTKPDVILLDLDLGGISSLNYLEKLTAFVPAKVLILTGSHDPAVHQQAVVHGARGVVHKQVAADVLLRAIQKVQLGEIWLDRNTLGRVLTAMSNGDKKSAESRKFDSLTAKEYQIAVAVVDEKCARIKVIADKMHMSEHTMRNHLTSIYDKLGVEGYMAMYLFAVEQLGHQAVQ